MKDMKKALENVIGGILESAQKETEENHGGIINQLKEIDMEHFDLFVRYPLENCVRAFHESDEGAFIYSNFGYVERSFSRLIESREGSACSVDKSRHIVYGLYKFYERGKEFSLIKEDKHFWITTSLTPVLCIEFFKALVSVHYGGHMKLFEFYKSLIEYDKKEEVK